MKDDVNGWCYHVDGNACHMRSIKDKKVMTLLLVYYMN